MTANPDGIRMPRAQRHALILQGVADGLTHRQIAESMGVSRKTVREVLYDPDGSKARARKERNCGVCGVCGARVSYRVGGPSDRCEPCSVRSQRTMEARRTKSGVGRRWSDEDVFKAIRAVARPDGTVSVDDYRAMEARRRVRRVPSSPQIVNRFGSWRLAVHAAGLRCVRENMPEAYANRIPTGEMLAAVRECRDEIGDWPGVNTYGRWASGRAVSAATIRKRFGFSWIKAIEAAREHKPVAS